MIRGMNRRREIALNVFLGAVLLSSAINIVRADRILSAAATSYLYA